MAVLPSITSLSLAVALLALAPLTGCDPKIGDSCAGSLDCAQEGTRLCDNSSPGGYCTVLGCDVGTCPDDAVCVQFFSVVNASTTCTSQDDCSLDEVCTVGGQCASRASEVRYCMAGCGSHGDCRGTGYECRDLERMGVHGGQPVRRAGETDADLHPFCAPSATCSADALECDLGDSCDVGAGRCVP